MEKIEQIFRHPPHLKILLLYHKDSKFMANISMLARTIKMSYVTTRCAVKDLIDAEVLSSLVMGGNRIIRVANTTQAQLVFNFIKEINNEDGKG